MSDPTSAPKLIGHRIVVVGKYLSRQLVHGSERIRKDYREEFVLKPGEHSSKARGELGHILSDDLLRDRLSKKDPDFRAIITHTVAEKEDLFEKAAG